MKHVVLVTDVGEPNSVALQKVHTWVVAWDGRDIFPRIMGLAWQATAFVEFDFGYPTTESPVPVHIIFNDILAALFDAL